MTLKEKVQARRDGTYQQSASGQESASALKQKVSQKIDLSQYSSRKVSERSGQLRESAAQAGRNAGTGVKVSGQAAASGSSGLSEAEKSLYELAMQPTNRQATAATRAAASRMAARGVSAYSAQPAEEPEMSEQELKEAAQRAEWEGYAADSRAARYESALAETHPWRDVVENGRVTGQKTNEVYQYLYDKMTEEYGNAKSAEETGSAASDELWRTTQRGNLERLENAAGGEDALADVLSGSPFELASKIQELAAASGLSEEEMEEVSAYLTQQANAEKQEKRSETAQKITDAVAKGVQVLAQIGSGHLGETGENAAATVGDVAASLGTVPANLAGGVLGFGSAVVQGLQNGSEIGHRPIDWNTGAMAIGNTATDVREMVGGRIAERYPAEILGTNVASFLYNTGMSMADSGAIFGLSMIGLPAAEVLLSGSAAFQAAKDAKERGGTDAQALGFGLASGIAEGLFEKISLESLTENIVGELGQAAARQQGAQKVLSILKSAGIQASTEGSEEVFTTIANTISDAIIMGDLSSYNESVQEYLAQGLSEEEAKKQASIAWGAGLLADFLGGAISGGVMGGAGVGISAAVNRGAAGAQTGEARPAAQTMQTPAESVQTAPVEMGQETPAPATNAPAVQTQTASAANVPAAQNVAEEADRYQTRNQEIDRVIDRVGSAGKSAFSQGYTDDLGTEAFYKYYELGKAGASWAAAKGGVPASFGNISQEQAQAAVRAGRYDAMAERVTAATGRRIMFYTAGKQENGYYDPADGVVYVNMKSGNPLIQVVAHELTHSTETAEVYDELSKMVLGKMGGKEELAVLRAQKKRLYARYGVQLKNDADVDAELVAEYVEEHLFSDEASILNLTQENRTLAQRIHGWIDRLLAKFGSDSAAERTFLEQTRELYAKALRETMPAQARQTSRQTEREADVELTDEELDAMMEEEGLAGRDMLEPRYDGVIVRNVADTGGYGKKSIQGTVKIAFDSEQVKSLDPVTYDDGNVIPLSERFDERKSDIRYSIRETDDGQAVAVVDNDILSEIDMTNWNREKKDAAKKAAKNALLAFKDGIQVNGITYKVNKKSRDEYTRSNDTEKQYRKTKEAFADKLRAAGNVDDIITATTDWARDGKLDHPREDNLVDFLHGNVLIRAGENKYRADVVVGVQNDGEYIFYDVTDMESAEFTEKEESPTNAAGNEATSAIQGDSSDGRIADNGLPVKRALRKARTPDTEYAQNGKNDTKKFSISENETEESAADDRRKPWQIEHDERAYLASQAGYPAINGIQVIPFLTTVHATDEYEVEGPNGTKETRHRDNYGRVVGLVDGDKRLWVEFWNKHVKMEDGEHPRQTVAIRYEDLAPVPGMFQNVDIHEDMASLFESAPEQGPIEAEKQLDIFELEQERSKEAARNAEKQRASWVETAVDSLPTKAKSYLRRVEKGLMGKLAEELSVPAKAQREFLEPMVREISEEYLATGTVSDESVTELFDTAWQQGIEVDETFYNEYKEVKDYLRTTAVTISDQDKSDIADFDLFRKDAFGRLRIVNNGGLPVDSAYMELREMAPGLFPDHLTHPADQLKQMLEIAENIKKVSKTLDDAHGHDAETYKQWAKNGFEEKVFETVNELRTVKRFTDERERKEQTPEADRIETVQQATEVYGKLKKARGKMERVLAKNLLTESDNRKVNRMMRGELELEGLNPQTDNVSGITAVYQARQEYEALTKPLREYNRRRKEGLRETAGKYLETSIDWKDKASGYLYSRETMERNVRDIVKDPELAQKIIGEYFRPVHAAQAESTRMKNRYRARVKELNLSRKAAEGDEVSESYAVQFLGEALDNIDMIEKSRGRMSERDGKSLTDWKAAVRELWSKNPGLDQERIEQAVEAFRKIYDELFQKMNETRVKNGYEPVNYRHGYFPHFQNAEEDGILARFGAALGISTDVTALPTTINGLTHTFKPGIQWFGNALSRTGVQTEYDAVQGFDKYIEGATDVIHQTENIQKLRALASEIRYRTSSESIQKQVDEIREDTSIAEIDKQNRINDLYEKGQYALANFVTELEEYTNLLANKKSRNDREVERKLTRRIYNVVMGLESRVAANMVAINPASWLTNFIPLTQGGAQIGSGTMLKAMEDTLRAYKTDDGFSDRSSFLTNRRGSDPMVRTWSQKTSAILASPMEYIDCFTADTLVRARYAQNVQRGMSEESAMNEADEWAAGVMADRSKGSMPTIFESKNPITKVFTQFQLEVNNQLSYLFKDLPRDAKDKGKKALAVALLKFFLGAFLYNEVYEFFIGRRPALDPIGILNDTVGDLTGYKLPNLVELGVGAIKGDAPGFRTERAGVTQAGANLAENVAEELPFIGGVLGGGRLPISSALPDVGNLWDAATDTSKSSERRLIMAAKELGTVATYWALPFGGGQMKKIYQGVQAMIQGGSYTVDSDGNDILEYPVFNDTSWNVVKNTTGALLFGKTTLGTGRDWVEGGFSSFSAKETAAYQGLAEADVWNRDAYDLILALRSAEPEGLEGKKQVQRSILREADISGKGKSVAYYALYASDAEQRLMETLDDRGVDMGTVTELLMDAADVRVMIGEEREAASEELRSNLRELALTDEEKGILAAAVDTTAGNTAEKLEDAGLSGEEVSELTYQLYQLEPEEGRDEVRKWQKYEAAAGMDWSESRKLAAMEALMGPDSEEYAKLIYIYNQGVAISDYVGLKDFYSTVESDKDASGETIAGSQKRKVLEYINGLNVSKQQKDELYYAVGYKGSTIDDAPWR